MQDLESNLVYKSKLKKGFKIVRIYFKRIKLAPGDRFRLIETRNRIHLEKRKMADWK